MKIKTNDKKTTYHRPATFFPQSFRLCRHLKISTLHLSQFLSVLLLHQLRLRGIFRFHLLCLDITWRVSVTHIHELMLFIDSKNNSNENKSSPSHWEKAHCRPHAENPIVTKGCPQLTPKLPLPLWRTPAPSKTPICHQSHSPPQIASGSNQPFCCITLSKLTDRQ